MSDKKKKDIEEMMDVTHVFGWELDKGIQRTNNEDSLGAMKVKQTSLHDKRSLGIYIVADGIGGEEGSEKASKLAVETVMSELHNHIHVDTPTEEVQQWLAQAAFTAHQLILKRKQVHEEVGGTTLVMAAVIENHVYIANIGDSRAYIIHDDTLRQVTQDHTVAQKFVDAGLITPEEAIEHPLSHVLSQAVGADEDEIALTPDIFTETVHAGDFVLLCTDGLYNSVTPAKIVQIVREADTPRQASQQLTKAANDAGGPDNIAVILVEIRQRQ